MYKKYKISIYILMYLLSPSGWVLSHSHHLWSHVVPVEVGLPYLPTSVYSSCSMWTHNSLSASSLPHNSWVEAVYHYSYSQVCRSRLLVCPCLSVSSSSISVSPDTSVTSWSSELSGDEYYCQSRHSRYLRIWFSKVLQLNLQGWNCFLTALLRRVIAPASGKATWASLSAARLVSNIFQHRYCL